MIGRTPYLPLTVATLLMTAIVPQLRAQWGTGIEPEVRRALPANAAPAPSATPPPTPIRDFGPLPVMKALPAGTPGAISPRPVATPISTVSAPPDTGGTIRIAPAAGRDPESLAVAQLATADDLFLRKQPQAAVAEYEKFLVMASGTTPGRERALFRLGESQRLMGSVSAAEATFQRLVEESPSGPFTPAASFRLGELRESRGYLDGAAASFDLAAKGTTDSAIREAARYREAVCYGKTGQKEQEETLLKELAESTDTPAKNSYRLNALLQLASLSAEAGKREEALAWYGKILSRGEFGTAGEAYWEAVLKAAVLNSELGRSGEARKLFEQVAASKDAGRWAEVASLGALRIASDGGDPEAVIRISEKSLATNPANKQEILLLRANALRKIGKNAKALEEYDRLLREFPASKAADSARFQRLLVLYVLRNDNLTGEIDQYLLTASDPAERARAQLLKAEETLRRGNHKEAAVLYHAIDPAALPESSRPDILYKEAWALTQGAQGAKKGAAVAALDRFLENYPDDQRSPSALAQRALLKQQDNDLAGAVADFSRLLERYPKSPERELALQQKALLLGQQQDNKGMAGTFALLLQDYPKSAAAPQAHYWIGWTAFEEKDYAAAVTELAAARTGDPKQFGERAGLRMLLAHYYQNHPAEAAREAAALKPSLIPPEVGRWLGLRMMETGDNAKAERFLSPLVKEGLPGAEDSEIQGALASALTAQGKFKEAQAPAAACLRLARDPASRARALLVAAAIQRSMKNLQQASSMTEEAMLLQPEGPLNAEARILSGDLLAARQDDAGAAKAYMTVGVLYEDPVLTPKALSRAVEAYRRAGNLTEARKALEELHKRFPSAPVSATTPPSPAP